MNAELLAGFQAQMTEMRWMLGTIHDLLTTPRVNREWYTTEEVAKILDRDPYTVREWARLGRIKAEERVGGRGRAKEWVISHEELTRYRNHGLLPSRK
jgi:hypothetical protein